MLYGPFLAAPGTCNRSKIGSNVTLFFLLAEEASSTLKSADFPSHPSFSSFQSSFFLKLRCCPARPEPVLLVFFPPRLARMLRSTRTGIFFSFKYLFECAFYLAVCYEVIYRVPNFLFHCTVQCSMMRRNVFFF